MTEQQVRARIFGEVADEYDRIRPAYPPALIDDVLAYARLGGAPALEVGAGTGKATVALAERGVAVTAVEPDRAVADLLARRVAGQPSVTVAATSFEDYAPERPFGLLFSAQAWHRTEPAGRWRRAAAALAPGGALALFWNDDRPADREVRSAILAAHEAHAPGIVPELDPYGGTSLARRWPRTDLDALAEFGDPADKLYRWERRMSIVDYVAYLSTRSAYRVLDERSRGALFQAILALPDGQITLRAETALYLARRLPG